MLAFTVLGLAGCAMALVAWALDWRGLQVEGPDGDPMIATVDQWIATVDAARVVHTYKGEGLTACGLEVVGPCPDCANGEGA